MALQLDNEDLQDILHLVRTGQIRDSSGYGNNTGNPNWGTAGQQFIRLTDPYYTDGMTGIRQTVNTPREISDIVSNQDNNGDGIEENMPNAFGGSAFLTFFGQYFDHGLDFVPKGQPGNVQIGSDGFPISASRANYAPGTGIDPDGTPGTGDEIAAQHVNMTSPYVDQNQVYGSNEEVTDLLRKWDQGPDGPVQTAYMLVGELDGSDRALLPTLNHVRENYRIMTGGEELTSQDISNFDGTGHALLLDFIPSYVGNNPANGYDLDKIGNYYITGDGRANENVMLTSMHTIWARNHNYWVDQLKERTNGAWTEEEYFQAARIVNTAEYQRVVFTEFADAMAGGIDLGENEHGFDGYNSGVDASISAEFAHVAYRFGHSMLNETVSYKDANGEMHDISLVQAFLSPNRLAELGIDELLLGSTGVAHQGIDVDVVNALRNQLVGRPLDLAALNIFRGRDTGIAPFNSVREQLYEKTNLASLRPYEGWEDFQQRNGLSDSFIDQLKEAYPEGFEHMDLWVGGLAEKPTKGQLGSTFGYLFLEQLDRLQDGDRFYYLEILDDSLFEGSGQTFADIIMRNTGITGLSDVFHVSSGGQTNGSRTPPAPVTHTPTDVSLSNNTVRETSSAGTIIGALSAVDADAGDTFTYTLSGPSAALFKVAGDKLVLAEGAKLDYEKAQSHEITVKVTDNTGRSYFETMTIKVQDVVEPKPDPTPMPRPPKDLVVKGGRGDDDLWGGSRNDRLYGEKGDDRLNGKAGNDKMYGGEGDDRLCGGTGADRMWGQKGNDTYEVDNRRDEVYESRGQGTDTVKASISYSLDKNVENLTLTGSGHLYAAGNELDNILIGNSGNNILKGDAGRDVLKGGDGCDILKGGKGNDVLTGGSDKDIFVFERSGHDTVRDYRDGVDKIDVSRLSGVDSRADLYIWQAGNDAVIWHKMDVMVLKGVNASDLGNSDFIY
jgi:Ca2+-binding RTX toxin-like protein